MSKVHLINEEKVNERFILQLMVTPVNSSDWIVLSSTGYFLIWSCVLILSGPIVSHTRNNNV